jgi:hypothetical protein
MANATTRDCFLLVLNGIRFDHEEVRRFLDSRKEVLNWATCLPGVYFIVSDNSVEELGAMCRELVDDQSMFILLSTKTKKAAVLPLQIIDFIRNPLSAEEELAEAGKSVRVGQPLAG